MNGHIVYANMMFVYKSPFDFFYVCKKQIQTVCKFFLVRFCEFYRMERSMQRNGVIIIIFGRDQLDSRLLEN